MDNLTGGPNTPEQWNEWRVNAGLSVKVGNEHVLTAIDPNDDDTALDGSVEEAEDIDSDSDIESQGDADDTDTD